MRIDLTDLTDREVNECNFQEARLIVRSLEDKLGATIEGTDAIETLEEYRGFSYTLYGRFHSGEFDEEIEKSGVSDKEVSQIKSLLTTLMVQFSYSYKMAELSKDLFRLKKDNEQLTKELECMRVNSINSTKEMQDAEAALRTSLNGLASQMETTVNHIEDVEHTTLTHVLTLMGVFSAIITVILSMATTSSAWLNNADAADALQAFIIPNLVTVLAVIVLVALVFVYQGSKTTRSVKREGKNGEVYFERVKTGAEGLTVRFGVLFGVILLLCVSIAAYSFIKTCEPIHTRYVVTPLDYAVCTESDPETEQEYKVCRFMIGKRERTFRYSEEYLHDGNLYYCSVHGGLE